MKKPRDYRLVEPGQPSPLGWEIPPIDDLRSANSIDRLPHRMKAHLAYALIPASGMPGLPLCGVYWDRMVVEMAIVEKILVTLPNVVTIQRSNHKNSEKLPTCMCEK